MTLLLVMNLGFAWGAQGTAPPITQNKTVASPKSAGSLKARG